MEIESAKETDLGINLVRASYVGCILTSLETNADWSQLTDAWLHANGSSRYAAKRAYVPELIRV